MRGSIIERPKDSGRFTAYWFTKDPATGKRVQHSKGGFSGERKAQSFLNTQLGKVETGGGRPDEKMSVERLLNDWLAAKKSSGLRPNTARMYQNVVNRWLLPHIGGLALAELSPTQ